LAHHQFTKHVHIHTDCPAVWNCSAHKCTHKYEHVHTHTYERIHIYPPLHIETYMFFRTHPARMHMCIAKWQSWLNALPTLRTGGKSSDLAKRRMRTRVIHWVVYGVHHHLDHSLNVAVVTIRAQENINARALVPPLPMSWCRPCYRRCV